jgi:hypothetical protein
VSICKKYSSKIYSYHPSSSLPFLPAARHALSYESVYVHGPQRDGKSGSAATGEQPKTTGKSVSNEAHASTETNGPQRQPARND